MVKPGQSISGVIGVKTRGVSSALDAESGRFDSYVPDFRKAGNGVGYDQSADP